MPGEILLLLIPQSDLSLQSWLNLFYQFFIDPKFNYEVMVRLKLSIIQGLFNVGVAEFRQGRFESVNLNAFPRPCLAFHTHTPNTGTRKIRTLDLFSITARVNS